MQRNYLIKLAYDGAAYHGWQIQENARTVQQPVQPVCFCLRHAHAVV